MKRKNDHFNMAQWWKIALIFLLIGVLLAIGGRNVYNLSIQEVALSLEPIHPQSSKLIAEDQIGSSDGNLFHKIYCATDKPRDVMRYMEQLDLVFRYQGVFDYYVSEIASTNLIFYRLVGAPQMRVTIYHQEATACPDGTRYDVHLYWERL